MRKYFYIKNFLSLLCSVLLIAALCACGQKPLTWQEQYDLGIRYLSEGNYEEAIIAFTAAIEIDPKRAEAYSSLADTYVAKGDYEKAIEVLSTSLEIVEGTTELLAKLDEIRTECE